jgi:hypothetical protein
VLESVDFIKIELQKIKFGDQADGDCTGLIENVKEFLSKLKAVSAGDTRAEIPRETERQQYYITSNRLNNISGSNSYKAVIRF